MVYIEQCSLSAFQQHAFILGQEILNHLFGGSDEGTQRLGPPLAQSNHGVDVHGAHRRKRR